MRIWINGVAYQVYSEFLTEAQIHILAGTPPDKPVWHVVNPGSVPCYDEQVCLPVDVEPEMHFRIYGE